MLMKHDLPYPKLSFEKTSSKLFHVRNFQVDNNQVPAYHKISERLNEKIYYN